MGAKWKSLKKRMADPRGIEPPNPWSQGKNANHLATDTGTSPRKIHLMTLILCQGTSEWMAISVWTSHYEMFACHISGSTIILFDPSNILQTINWVAICYFILCTCVFRCLRFFAPFSSLKRVKCFGWKLNSYKCWCVLWIFQYFVKNCEV